MNKFISIMLAMLAVSVTAEASGPPPVIWDASCASGIYNLPLHTCLAAGSGGVSSVTASLPLVSSGGANPNISTTVGNFTVSAPFSVTGGTGAVFGTGIAFGVASGYYIPTTTDETNWNSKQNALTFTAPLVDTSNTVTVSTATNSTLGVVEGIAAVAHQWINSFVAGVPQLSQPAFTDISGTATVGQGGTGETTFTSNLPLLGNGTGALAQGTRSGNTTDFATASGTLTSGDCLEADANGNVVTTGVACGGTGVTSVGLTTPSWLTVSGSPVTGSGTLAVTGTSETANYFLAAPNGSSGAMAPRAIVAADIPTLNQSTTGTAAGLSSTLVVGSGGTGDTTFTSNLPLIGNGTGALAQGTVSGNTTEFGTVTGSLTSGDCLEADASGNIETTGAPCDSVSGTVTSVALTTPSWLTVSGSPITSSGTLAVTGTSETANYFLAAPNGSAGALAPRAIVAADIPTLNQNTTGSAGSLSQTLTANLPVIGNGTGVTTGTRSGNTTEYATSSGTYTSGHCIDIDSNGNLIDSGAACGSGTVSSVGFGDTSTTPIYGFSGTPVTTSGTINQSLLAQLPGTIFAGPIPSPSPSASAQPTFRLMSQWDIPGAFNPSGRDEGYTPFTNNTANMNGWGGNTNGGQIAVDNSVFNANHPGVIRLGTAASSSASPTLFYGTGSSWLLGGGVFQWEGAFQLSALSNSTDTYNIRVGLQNSYTSATPTMAVYLAYSSTVNSGNWQCIAISDGVSTTANASFGPAASTWYRADIVVNAPGTSATISVNGTAACTVTSNIPTTATYYTSQGFDITKTAGTTATNMYVNYAAWLYTFTTPR